jgi:SAM-dependent methyltransferase
MQAITDAYLAQACSPEHGEHWSGPPEMVDRIAQMVGTRRHHQVLDLGCGVGGPARRLHEIVGCEIVALDRVPALVDLARERTRRCGGMRYLVADGAALPFRPASFDQVWCLGTAAHVGGLGWLTAGAGRVLRAGGVLAVTEAFWDGTRRPRFASVAPSPWHPLAITSFVDALRASGFVEIQVRAWPGADLAPDAEVRNPALRADLLDGRLRSRLVLGRAG